MDELLKRITAIETAVTYNTKLLEELTMAIRSKDGNSAAIKSQMEVISKMFSDHPAVKNDPHIASVMSQIPKVFEDIGS